MPSRILIVDDELSVARSFRSLMESEGLEVRTADTVASALETGRDFKPDAVVCDIQLPDGSGLDVLRSFRESSPQTPIIMITAYATVETAVQALREGAGDYLTKPLRFQELLACVRRQLTMMQDKPRTKKRHGFQLGQNEEQSQLIGHSPAIERVRHITDRVAPTPSSVLITGESGTGKDLIARRLHAHSDRAEEPFLAVNCGAIPESLMESELFGYKKGAFTGAVQDKLGMFELAGRGTLFLDEIGDLPLALQPKLLRALEQREFVPLGSTRPARARARVIAASNRPLQRMIDEGTFREDLFFRLSLIEIQAPPLRHCRQDIPALVEVFVRRLNAALGLKIEGVTPDAMERLVEWEWPGNVRELQHRLERAMILATETRLRIPDLWEGAVAVEVEGETLRDAARAFEIRHIRATLARVGGDKREAASQLGISLAGLYAKLKEPPPAAAGAQGFQDSGMPPRKDSSKLDSEPPEADAGRA